MICYFPDSVIVIELFFEKFWWMDILVFLKFEKSSELLIFRRASGLARGGQVWPTRSVSEVYK